MPSLLQTCVIAHSVVYVGVEFIFYVGVEFIAYVVVVFVIYVLFL